MNGFDFQAGKIILINKELHFTSFDVVKYIRNLLLKKFHYDKLKVGHAGTLDPLATGLLIICTGNATHQISKIQELDKEYIASICLGSTTPSFDLETEIDNYYPIAHITSDSIHKTLSKFTGEITQIPPEYSAKKINGTRAYTLARKGRKIELHPQIVNIKNAELLSCQLPEINVRFVCSKGTYIRSLVRDIGYELGSGAYLSGLQRVRIGDFQIEKAYSLQSFEEMLKNM
ncbi:MAG: tRNA pseudouridine(55) synthase TruB [Bacteroidia bacterium]|nr:tRNA pseudouridine(55) synthase TruB [Bacteroidia bacterium]